MKRDIMVKYSLKEYFMKKTFLTLFLIFIGFAAYSQPKMIQQSTINDFSIRWLHDSKSKVDCIELCKSPKFDDIVYRFVADENTGAEFVIPQLESAVKFFAKGIPIEENVVLSSEELFTLGSVLSLFIENVDMDTAKRIFELDWCKCLCVYNDLDIECVTDNLIDLFSDF